MAEMMMCPECGQWSAYWDEYFKAWMCTRVACGYFERPEKKTCPECGQWVKPGCPADGRGSPRKSCLPKCQ